MEFKQTVKNSYKLSILCLEIHNSSVMHLLAHFILSCYNTLKSFAGAVFIPGAAKSSDIPNLITKGTFNEKDLYKSHGKHEFF